MIIVGHYGRDREMIIVERDKEGRDMNKSTFIVRIEALAENCAEIYFENEFTDYDVAKERFEDLVFHEVRFGLWGDNRRVVLYECRGDYRTGAHTLYSDLIYEYKEEGE